MDAPSPASLRIDPQAIPHDAYKVLRRLDHNRFKGYLVGGCVRDLLAGFHPKDFDIATDATPRQVKRLFRNSRIIGRRFRLVHVRFGHHILEVSTFRAPPPETDDDDPYIRQDNEFGTEEQDAFRRDFTINALFYDPLRTRIVDHVGGLPDLAARRLRIIGDPQERLREDPVRILRAARFAGKLDLSLTDDLRDAATAHAGDLCKAAPPRVLEEIYKLLSGGGSAHAFRLLDELGALAVLAPEMVPLGESFYDALTGLEKLGGGDRSRLTQSLMAAVLCEPLARPVLERSGIHDAEAALNEVLRPFGTRLTIAKRDLAIARQCLAAQLRFLRQPRGRGDRNFVRREHFREALALRRLLGPIGEPDLDPLPHWEALARENRAAPEVADARPKKRRRRRGRRGGRRRGLSPGPEGGKEEACPPSASSSAPARSKRRKASPTPSSDDDSSRA